MEDVNNSPIRAFLKNKAVRLIMLLDAAIVIAIVCLIVMKANRTSYIRLNIAPIDATISVNGNTSFENGIYSVAPGSYELSISRDGLETKTFTVNVEPGHVATVESFLKGADNSFDFYESKSNYNSYLKLKEIVSVDGGFTTDNDQSAEQFISDVEYRLSISGVLPIKGYIYADPTVGASTGGFAIRDGMSMDGCERIECLLVNYYGEGYKEAASDKIKENGYDPTDYQIIYEPYR